MKQLVVSILLSLVISCKKDADEDSFKGVWVEKTMRLDTVEFNSILSSTHQSLYLRSQSPVISMGYNYQVKTDSLLLKSFPSPGPFVSYYFNFNSSKEFTISNFFMRPGLSSVVRFEKMK